MVFVGAIYIVRKIYAGKALWRIGYFCAAFAEQFAQLIAIFLNNRAMNEIRFVGIGFFAGKSSEPVPYIAVVHLFVARDEKVGRCHNIGIKENRFHRTFALNHRISVEQRGIAPHFRRNRRQAVGVSVVNRFEEAAWHDNHFVAKHLGGIGGISHHFRERARKFLFPKEKGDNILSYVAAVHGLQFVGFSLVWCAKARW